MHWQYVTVMIKDNSYSTKKEYNRGLNLGCELRMSYSGNINHTLNKNGIVYNKTSTI
jgi:hypothetical protein